MKLSFKIIGYGGWKLFWQLMRKWLSEKFEGVSAAIANIDLSPISNKVDEVKSDVSDVKADVADVKTDVADVKTAVENIDFTELAKDSTVAKQGDDQTATNTAIYNKLGNLVEADSEEYAAFKAHIEEAIEEVLTPIEEEENND